MSNKCKLVQERAPMRPSLDELLNDMPLPAADAVHHPDHYNSGTIECIDYIRDNLGEVGFSYYLDGNIKKYLHRWRYKNRIEDLRKAQWYQRLLIEVEEGLEKVDGST